MRVRAVQLTAVAAVLIALAQMGRMITGESMTPKTRTERTVASKSIAAIRINQVPARPAGVLSKTDGRTIADTSSRLPPAGAACAKTPPLTRRATSRYNLQRGHAAAKTKKSSFKDEKTPAAAAESNAEFVEESPQATPASNSTQNRKLIRNATAELEVASFDESVQKITAFAAEEKGYVSTTSSEKQANGKLRGEIVVKVLPDNLDRFLGKLRAIGELKNQALTTEDVTKAYFDTESRLKNARLMEQRLIEILKTKSKDVGICSR